MKTFQPRALIFDMDGTIVLNHQYHLWAWMGLFHRLGVTISTQKLLALASGQTSIQILRKIFGPRITPTEVLLFTAYKEFIYRAIYRPFLRPIEGVKEFLEAAHHHNLPIALATLAGKQNIAFTINGLGIASYFDLFVAAEEFPNGKKDPEVFRSLAKRLNTPPEDCLVFEDSTPGMIGAGLAGMKIIAINRSKNHASYLHLPGIIDVAPDFKSMASILVTGINIHQEVNL